METSGFDPRTYEVEGQITIKQSNDNNNAKEQINICPVDNIVRWRFPEGPKDQAFGSDQIDSSEKAGSAKQNTINSVVLSPNEQQSGQNPIASGLSINDLETKPGSSAQLPIESNTRLVEWSDGSFSLVIGDEVFDIRHESLPESGIFLKCDQELAVQKGTVD